MAKSIRSKVKKRNRTEMRKTVGRPHENKLQSKCTAKLLDSVKRRKDPQSRDLQRILRSAQAVNPVVVEPPKSSFTFRHPDAKAKPPSTGMIYEGYVTDELPELDAMGGDINQEGINGPAVDDVRASYGPSIQAKSKKHLKRRNRMKKGQGVSSFH
eukprot:526760_1